jgi:uncharacterized protein with NAD-binding domain and iron-sulfur cluster
MPWIDEKRSWQSELVTHQFVPALPPPFVVDSDGGATTFEADAVVFAVGVNAMQRIVATSPALADRSDFAAFSNLGGVNVLATKLWLDKKVTPPNPSNVFSGFDATTGRTFFDLNALQVRNW